MDDRNPPDRLPELVAKMSGAGLWVPQHLDPHPSSGPHCSVYLGYTELFPDGGNAREQYWQLLQNVPVVNAIGVLAYIGNLLTLTGQNQAIHSELWRLPYELYGVPPADEQRRPELSAIVVSPGYFRTLGAAILSGREFNETDGVSGGPVALVNERFAIQNWPGEDPIGKRLRLFQGTPFDRATRRERPAAEDWLTVVGVTANIVQNDGTRQQFEPLIYLPYRQKPQQTMWVLVRTSVPPESLGTALQREVQALDSELPIWLGPFALSERLAGGYWSQGLHGAVLLIFAAIALLLASVGLYAVMAHAVTGRTQEIGVRLALGATASDIRRLVFQQGMLPLGIGLIVGLAASFAVNRVLETELVEVSPADPAVLAGASAVLIFSAALGCLIPARRAMRVDPVVALRHE